MKDFPQKYMDIIGGADNFCLQKSRMPMGRIGIFTSFKFNPDKRQWCIKEEDQKLKIGYQASIW